MKTGFINEYEDDDLSVINNNTTDNIQLVILHYILSIYFYIFLYI